MIIDIAYIFLVRASSITVIFNDVKTYIVPAIFHNGKCPSWKTKIFICSRQSRWKW